MVENEECKEKARQQMLLSTINETEKNRLEIIFGYERLEATAKLKQMQKLCHFLFYFVNCLT